MAKKNVIVEVDIFLPKGRTMNDWDFIKSESMEVQLDNINADTENVGLEIRRVLEEWLSNTSS